MFSIHLHIFCNFFSFPHVIVMSSKSLYIVSIHAVYQADLVLFHMHLMGSRKRLVYGPLPFNMTPQSQSFLFYYVLQFPHSCTSFFQNVIFPSDPAHFPLPSVVRCFYVDLLCFLHYLWARLKVKGL